MTVSITISSNLNHSKRVGLLSIPVYQNASTVQRRRGLSAFNVEPKYRRTFYCRANPEGCYTVDISRGAVPLCACSPVHPHGVWIE